MGEPLKDKLYCGCNSGTCKRKVIASVKDIKSAVEWLRDEMCKLGVKFGCEIKKTSKDSGIPVIPQIAMGRLIDKAFPDLCSQSNEKTVKKQ